MEEAGREKQKQGLQIAKNDNDSHSRGFNSITDSKKEKWEDAMKAFNGTKDEKDRKITDLTNQLTEAIGKVNNFEAQIKNLEERKGRVELDLSTLKAEIDQAQRKCELLDVAEQRIEKG